MAESQYNPQIYSIAPEQTSTWVPIVNAKFFRDCVATANEGDLPQSGILRIVKKWVAFLR